MVTATLVRPQKSDQCAALMLTAFKVNPDVVMTLREIESLVDVSQFSPSTRQRALWGLCHEKHIRYEQHHRDDGWFTTTSYWMPMEKEVKQHPGEVR